MRTDIFSRSITHLRLTRKHNCQKVKFRGASRHAEPDRGAGSEKAARRLHLGPASELAWKTHGAHHVYRAVPISPTVRHTVRTVYESAGRCSGGPAQHVLSAGAGLTENSPPQASWF